jgi:hypothetical protein
VVRTFSSEAEKREHVIKLNLARRHLDPLRWGRAFQLLLEERGVENGKKHNRHTPREATVAALAEELGVPERTARSRVAQAEKYDALPAEEKAKVDSGETTVHKAARATQRRAKLEEQAAEAKPVPKKSRRWEIRHGDVLEELAKIEAGSVDLVFSDPPYNQEVDYGRGTRNDLNGTCATVAQVAEELGVPERTAKAARDTARGAAQRREERGPEMDPAAGPRGCRDPRRRPHCEVATFRKTLKNAGNSGTHKVVNPYP